MPARCSARHVRQCERVHSRRARRSPAPAASTGVTTAGGAVSSQDYKLLERMNLATAEKYRDLADHAENLLVARETMLTKCTSPMCAAASSCACVLPSTCCIFVKAKHFLRAALNRLPMLRNACSIDFQLCNR